MNKQNKKERETGNGKEIENEMPEKVEGVESDPSQSPEEYGGCHEIVTAPKGVGSPMVNGHKCYAPYSKNPYYRYSKSTLKNYPCPLLDLWDEEDGLFVLDYEYVLTSLRSLNNKDHWLWNAAKTWDDAQDMGKDFGTHYAVKRRNQYMMSLNRCSEECEETRHSHCPCMLTREAASIIGKNRICENPAFFENLKHYLKGRATGLKLHDGFSKAGNGSVLSKLFDRGEEKKKKKDAMHNFYSLLVLTLDDEFIGDFNGEGYWFNLYYIREKLGIEGDFGYKRLLETGLQAQNNPALKGGEEEEPASLLGRIWESMKNAGTSLKDVIAKAVSKVWDAVQSIIGFVSAPIVKFLEKVKQMVINLMKKCLIGISEEILRKIRDSYWIKAIAATTIIFSMVVLVMANILSHLAIRAIFESAMSLFRRKRTTGNFTAQQDTPPGMVEGLMATLFELRLPALDQVKKACLTVTALMAGGTALYSLSGHLFALLPVALRTALTYQFGSKAMIAKHEVQNWYSRANAILQVSKVPCVLRSDVYFEKIKALLKEGSDLIRQVKEHALRLLINGPFVRLAAIATTLTQYRHTPSTRQAPYVIHFYGEPGVGKTLVTEKLAAESFGIYKDGLYNRNVNSEYWDGCADPDMVIMDEFMVGNADDRLKHGKEYLVLCSTGQFQPQMASVDNPTVGIKGTILQPKVVWSMNNNASFRVEGLDNKALNRRRNVVIEMKGRKGYFKDNVVDLKSLSLEQIKDVVWAKFQIWPSIVPGGYVNKTPELSYPELVEFLKRGYEVHREGCETVAKALGGGMSETVDPEALINEALRECYGLPGKVPTVKEALLNIFGMGSESSEEPMQAQGPGMSTESEEEVDDSRENFPAEGESQEQGLYYEIGKRRKNGPHIHNCCGQIFEHESIRKFACPKCHEENECVPTIRNTGKGPRWPRYNENIPTLSPTNHEGKHDVKHAHKCSHAGCTVRIVHLHGSPTMETHGPRSCFQHQVANIAASQGLNDSHGSNSGHNTQRYLCAFPKCDNQMGMKNAKAGLKYCKAHRSQSKMAPLAGDLMAGNITIDEAIEKYKYDENGNMREEYYDAFIHTVKEEGWETMSHILAGLTAHNENFNPWNALRNGLETGAMIGLVIVTIQLIQYAFGKSEEEEPMSFGAQSNRPQRMSGGNNKGKRTFKKTNFAAQAAAEIKAVTINFAGRDIQAYPISGRVFVTYLHGVKDLILKDASAPMVHMKDGKPYRANFVMDLSVTDPDCDLIMFSFENHTMSQYPDNIKKFITRAELNMIEFGKQPVPFVVQTISGKKYSTAIRREEITYSHSSGNITVSDCWRYAAPTVDGDCGSLLVAASGPIAGKIIGMHVAGTGNKVSVSEGLAVSVNRDDLEEALSLIVNGAIPALDEDVVLQAQGIHPFGCYMEDELSKAVSSAFVPGTGEVTSAMGNLRIMAPVPKDQIVAAPTRTKIVPSMLYGTLDVQSVKQPAILSRDDPRARGYDPGALSMLRTLDRKPIVVDNELVKETFTDLYRELAHQLCWKVQRQLTFEEACKGIPGLLSSLRVKTSAGYPLIKTTKGKGKQEYIWFDQEGNFHYEPEFEKLVRQKLSEMARYKGDPSTIDHVFLGYLKDELVSEKKIKDIRTRMIYANDLVCLVAFRMLYGSIFIAFQNSPRIVAAIGVNQYSHMMNGLHDQLTSLNTADVSFIDGDICEWDYRMVPQFQEGAYGVIKQLAKQFLDVPAQMSQFMHDHETKTPMQVGAFQFSTICNQASGCFWTTILNCLVNEAYVRYIFKITHPHLIFEEQVRMKALGDDHIIAVTKNVDWNPKILSKHYAELLDQQYTSSVKGAELEDYRKTFNQITFLGAHPVRVEGLWCGAMKKDTIYQTLQWCKKGFEEDIENITTMLEYASVWGQSFYDHLHKQIYPRVEALGVPELTAQLAPKNAKTLARVVANRTSGDFFVGFLAENDPARFHAQGPNDPGLLTATTQEMGTSEPLPLGFSALADKAVNATTADIGYGLESEMFRGSFDWNDTQSGGTTLFSFILPQDLLALGNPDNVQNMMFQRFIYATMDIELIFEITGQPSQCGKLIIWESPLSAYSNTIGDSGTYFPNLGSIFQMNHICLEPNRSATEILRINFKAYRSAMNTFTFGDALIDYMSTIHMTVASPLRTKGDSRSAVITMRSRFVNARFTIPRPIAQTGKFDPVTNRRFEPTRIILGKNVDDLSEIRNHLANETRQSLMFSAQGANVSNVYNTSNVTISDVGGSVPYQGQYKPDTKPSQSLSPDISAAIPMHNPPMVGGAIPAYGQLPSLSRAIGPACCHALQLHPQEMNRETQSRFNNDEISFDQLFLRPVLTRANASGWPTKWTTSQPSGEIIRTIPLDSHMLTGPFTDPLSNLDDPFQEFIWNHFSFWRASEIVVDFELVKTRFHAGKLMVVIAYGSPNVESLDRNVYISRVLDFSDDTNRASLTIPWSAGTQYLRTVDFTTRNSVLHPQQDYSLGTMQVSVLNQLRANDTVVEDLDLLIYFRFKEMRLYEPKPTPYITVIPTVPYPVVRAKNPFQEDDSEELEYDSEEPEFHAQGVSNHEQAAEETHLYGAARALPDTTIAGTETNEVSADGKDPIRSVKITGHETPHVGGKPMNLYVGEKFEYHPLTVLDIMRRHYNILHRGIGGETLAYNLTTYYDWAGRPTTTPATAGDTSFVWPTEVDPRQGRRYALTFLVKPRHPFASLYAAWAGHMKYRFVLKLKPPAGQLVPFNPPKVGFFPFPPQIVGNAGSDFAAFVASSFWQGSRENGSVLYNTNQTHSLANEHLSILPDGTYHIDVQVPFSTHYNMLPVLPDTTSTITENVSGIPGSPGWISLSFPALGEHTTSDVNFIRDFKIEIYEAVGDDFVLAHLRPCGISGGFYGWKGIFGGVYSG
jgi:hypothetical protein